MDASAILETIEDAVGKQTDQMVSLFVTKEQFSQRKSLYDDTDIRIKLAKSIKSHANDSGTTQAGRGCKWRKNYWKLFVFAGKVKTKQFYKKYNAVIG